MTFDEAVTIASDIVEDLSDRSGLKQAWESMDTPTRAEIIIAWAEIIRGEEKA